MINVCPFAAIVIVVSESSVLVECAISRELVIDEPSHVKVQTSALFGAKQIFAKAIPNHLLELPLIDLITKHFLPVVSNLATQKLPIEYVRRLGMLFKESAVAVIVTCFEFTKVCL